MPAPALYLRVSDPRQGENYSLPAQERAGRAYCAELGFPDPVVFREEGASAFNDDPDARRQFRRLLAAAEAGEIDRLVTLDIDRFARSTLAALLALSRLEAVGARVVFINDPMDTLTPEGKLMFTIKASLAELESAKKAARVRLSQDLMRAEGKWLSRPPYGARIGPDGRLRPDPANSPILRRILEEAARDPDSAIAERLTAEGIPTPGSDRKPGRWGEEHGGAWWPTTIRSIIRQGGWLASQHDPWPSLWLAASERPRRPKAPPGRAIRRLSGLMRCPCGGVITYGGRRGPLDRLTVQCHGIRARGRRAHCPHRKTYADVYEADVLAQLAAVPDPRDWMLVEADERASAARAELEDDYRRLADVYRAKILTKAQFEAELRALDLRKAALPSGSPRVAAVREHWAALLAALPGAEPADQNAFLREIIEAVFIEGRRARIVWRAEFSAATGLDGERAC